MHACSAFIDLCVSIIKLKVYKVVDLSTACATCVMPRDLTISIKLPKKTRKT